MDLKTRQILQTVTKRQRGSFMRIKFKSKVDLKSAYKNLDVVKITECTCAIGINYYNIGTVKQFLQQGNELKSRIWGTNVQGYENYLVEHKGNYYLKLFKRRNWRPVQTFLFNGQPITKEELMRKGIVRDSYWKENDDFVTFSPKIDNIIEIKETRKNRVSL